MISVNSLYGHVVLDLETLGVTPGCIVTSIGIAGYSVDGMAVQFNQQLSIFDGLAAGCTYEQNTLNWWKQQSKPAQLGSLYGQATAAESMELLNDWLGVAGIDCIWGNGSDFDNVILKEYAIRVGVPLTNWPQKGDRCLRTLKKTLQDAGYNTEYARSTDLFTPHIAIDDARYEFLLLDHLIKLLKETKEK